MTTPQIIKLISAIATSADAVLAYGDRIADVPGIPPSLAHSWPLILMCILAIDRGLHAYLGDPVPMQVAQRPFLPETPFIAPPPPYKIPTEQQQAAQKNPNPLPPAAFAPPAKNTTERVDK